MAVVISENQLQNLAKNIFDVFKELLDISGRKHFLLYSLEEQPLHHVLSHLNYLVPHLRLYFGDFGNEFNISIHRHYGNYREIVVDLDVATIVLELRKKFEICASLVYYASSLNDTSIRLWSYQNHDSFDFLKYAVWYSFPNAGIKYSHKHIHIPLMYWSIFDTFPCVSFDRYDNALLEEYIHKYVIDKNVVNICIKYLLYV
jgi:hypothetical protein